MNRHSALLNMCFTWASTQHSAFSPGQLADVAWAVAALDHYCAPLVNRVVRSLGSSSGLVCFSLGDVVNMMWALAQLRVYNAAACDAVCRRVVAVAAARLSPTPPLLQPAHPSLLSPTPPPLQPDELSLLVTALYSLVQVGVFEHGVMRAVAGSLEGCLDLLSSEDLVMLIWAYSLALQHMHTPWLPGQLSAAGHGPDPAPAPAPTCAPNPAPAGSLPLAAALAVAASAGSGPLPLAASSAVAAASASLGSNSRITIEPDGPACCYAGLVRRATRMLHCAMPVYREGSLGKAELQLLGPALVCYQDWARHAEQAGLHQQGSSGSGSVDLVLPQGLRDAGEAALLLCAYAGEAALHYYVCTCRRACVHFLAPHVPDFVGTRKGGRAGTGVCVYVCVLKICLPYCCCCSCWCVGTVRRHPPAPDGGAVPAAGAAGLHCQAGPAHTGEAAGMMDLGTQVRLLAGWTWAHR